MAARSRDAARRERQRLNAGLGRTLVRVGIAVGVDQPRDHRHRPDHADRHVRLPRRGRPGDRRCGACCCSPAGAKLPRPMSRPTCPTAQMVQRFDSYLFRARRALPAPAQAELDLLSAQLPPLRQTLERIPDLDPNAQDARRLMSVHLPNLIDRYLHVPARLSRRTRRRRHQRRPAAGRGAGRRPRRR